MLLPRQQLVRASWYSVLVVAVLVAIVLPTGLAFRFMVRHVLITTPALARPTITIPSHVPESSSKLSCTYGGAIGRHYDH